MSKPQTVKTGTLEEFLTERGFTYELHPAVPLKEIIIDRLMQTRTESVIDSLKARYVVALRNGAIFPPVVGIRSGTGFKVLDGTHRLAAFKEVKRPTMEVLEITNVTEPDQLRTLAVMLNLRNGQAPTPNELMVLALDRVRRLGETQAAVALEYGINQKTLSNRLTVMETRDELDAQGVPTSKFRCGLGGPTPSPWSGGGSWCKVRKRHAQPDHAGYHCAASAFGGTVPWRRIGTARGHSDLRLRTALC